METRELLVRVSITDTPTGRLLALFRHHFFQALQRNANVQFLAFYGVDFSSNNTEGILPLFAGAAPALTKIKLSNCGAEDEITARNLGTALQRNRRIEILQLFVLGRQLRAIFHGLASSNSTAGLKTLIFGHTAGESIDLQSLQEYLESPNATIQCLQLASMEFGSVPSQILCGLDRNTSVHELVLGDCNLSHDQQQQHADALENNNHNQHSDLFDEQPGNQQLPTLLQSKTNLTTIRICNGYHLFVSHQFRDALENVLVRRDSPLHCLDVDLDDIHVNWFRSLVMAVGKSIRLNHLVLHCRCSIILRALAEAILSFKVAELCLFVRPLADNDEEEHLLMEAFKRNYSIQTVTCKHVSMADDETNWFSDDNQARLEFFLDRNRKLAQWTANPKLVPQELWTYALNLAKEAGVTSLFQSLLALSGQGFGLRQQGQKRKHPQYYSPSS